MCIRDSGRSRRRASSSTRRSPGRGRPGGAWPPPWRGASVCWAGRTPSAATCASAGPCCADRARTGQVVGDLEDAEELVPAEVLQREDVAACKTTHYWHLPVGSTDSIHNPASTGTPRPTARPRSAGPAEACGESWFTRRLI